MLTWRRLGSRTLRFGLYARPPSEGGGDRRPGALLRCRRPPAERGTPPPMLVPWRCAAWRASSKPKCAPKAAVKGCTDKSTTPLPKMRFWPRATAESRSGSEANCTKRKFPNPRTCRVTCMMIKIKNESLREEGRMKRRREVADPHTDLPKLLQSLHGSAVVAGWKPRHQRPPPNFHH